MLRNALALMFVLAVGIEASAGNLVISANDTIDSDVNDNVTINNGASVVITATIGGNLTIEEGATAILSEAVINGNVKVRGDGQFVVTPTGGTVGSQVNGNVIANRAAGVLFLEDAGTTVTGNVIVKRSGPDVVIAFTDVRGNVILKRNETGVAIILFEVTVEGNLICSDNLPEPPELTDVTVNGNIICD